MKNYTKPTLTINGYIVANKDICNVSDVIIPEKIDWRIDGVDNGLQNGLK